MEITKFQKRVYELCKKVPEGKVTTYKILAEKLGTKAYRAVGAALNRNPFAPKVPCYRVVGSNGHLTGFAHGLKKKSEFLRKEGIIVRDFKIVDFNEVLFRF